MKMRSIGEKQHNGWEYLIIGRKNACRSLIINITRRHWLFEVHSTAGVNITIPCVPDEIKVRDEQGVFQNLLTY